jgi:predicted dienelactone hydrolase
MRRTLIVVTTLLIAACSSSPSTPTPQSSVSNVTITTNYVSSESGEKAVGVIPVATLHDAKRNKDVELSIDYPIHGLSYPVIVFSHGYGGSGRAYESLAAYWTSYGYVVIRPSHADANALRDLYEQAQITPSSMADRRRERRDRSAEGPPAAGERVRTFVKNAEEGWEKEGAAQWRDRAADISFVIDSLDDLEQRFPELHGKMDHARIGVGGHSYGALTAMLISGMTVFTNPVVTAADPRVKAIVAMSPQGVNVEKGWTNQSWASVKIPALYMTGSNDYGTVITDGPDWRRLAYVNSPPGDKYYVDIAGARHLSFTGRASELSESFAQMRDERPQTMNPRGGAGMADTGQARRPSGAFGAERQIFSNIRQISLAFWDAFLKNDAKGRNFLDKDLEAAKSASVKVERK